MKEDDMELVAKTFQGFEDVLAEELKDLGASAVKVGRRMVSFHGDKAMLYKANLCCRTALRILKPFFKIKASDTDELYDAVKKYDWEQLLTVDQTFAIDSVVNSESFRHSKFVTYRVKDAIADFFFEKYGKRPSIRLTNPDILLNVHILDEEVIISLDSSGESLHKRGYRVEQTEAPINEVLAAGLILKTGWRGESDFVDPMCGSGTFLIEAALIAANINPGVYRTEFAFEHWPDFDAELFESIYNDDSGEREFNYKIYGSDISPRAIDIASRNVKRAGVGRYVDLKVMPIQRYEQAPANGILVTNPPYGERISADDMDALYESIGERLKKVFKGYHAWILGYKQEYFDKIGLKPSVKIPVLNGALECEFREYVIFDGSYSDFRRRGLSLRDPRRQDERDRRNERGGASHSVFGRRGMTGRHVEREGDRDEGKVRRFDRERRLGRQTKPKNALEEKYHKPYSERMREERRKKAESREKTADFKPRSVVQFRKPRLFDDSETGGTVLRHRRAKDGVEPENAE